MTQRKIGKYWWVDITHEKTRHRKKSPDNSKSGAQAYEATLRRQLAEGVSMEDTQQRERQTQRFDEFAQFWFKTHVLVHNKPSVIARSRGILFNKLIPFFGATALNKISTLQVEKYKAMIRSTGVVNKTVNIELTVLGKCLRDAQRWFDLQKIPEIVPLTVPPIDHHFLDEVESGQFLAELSGLWYDVVYTALKTGLRLGELRGLRWCDVDLASKRLTVRNSWCEVSKRLVSPKSNKVRFVPLTDDVVELLAKRERKKDIVFNVGEKVFSGQRVNEQLEKASKRAGLRKVTCHVLRHSYASQLAMKGIPIVVIQKLLGHTDIKVTMRYAHLSQSSVNEAAQVLQTPYETFKKAA